MERGLVYPLSNFWYFLVPLYASFMVLIVFKKNYKMSSGHLGTRVNGMEYSGM